MLGLEVNDAVQCGERSFDGFALRIGFSSEPYLQDECHWIPLSLDPRILGLLEPWIPESLDPGSPNPEGSRLIQADPQCTRRP